jgi:hypothetical protein
MELPKKYEVKCTREFLNAFFNIPEDCEILHIANNFDGTFSFIMHKIGAGANTGHGKSYEKVTSTARLNVKRTENVHLHDLIEWKDWDIQ